MEKEIKELRVRIDGLAQLTKGITPEPLKSIDVTKIPYNYTVEDFLSQFKKGLIISHAAYTHTVIDTKFKEIEKATDSLYLAKSWLGKFLEKIGTDSPYKTGYKTKEDIVPTSDVSKVLCTTGLEGIRDNQTWKEKNHIEKVDWLRTEIEKLNKEFKDYWFKMFGNLDGFFYSIVYTHLSEARFWLEFELQRIKENE